MESRREGNLALSSKIEVWKGKLEITIYIIRRVISGDAVPPFMAPFDIIGASGKLKTVKRQGWLDAGVKDAESVADHSFRTAFIVAFFGDEASDKSGRKKRGGKFDVLRAVRMALIHDMAEAEIGDITPHSGISRGKKAQLEEAAIRKLGDERILALWKEYEKGKTPEAIVVRQADVLERVLQSGEYIAAGNSRKRLAKFRRGWQEQVKSKVLRELVRLDC